MFVIRQQDGNICRFQIDVYDRITILFVEHLINQGLNRDFATRLIKDIEASAKDFTATTILVILQDKLYVFDNETTTFKNVETIPFPRFSVSKEQDKIFENIQQKVSTEILTSKVKDMGCAYLKTEDSKISIDINSMTLGFAPIEGFFASYLNLESNVGKEFIAQIKALLYGTPISYLDIAGKTFALEINANTGKPEVREGSVNEKQVLKLFTDVVGVWCTKKIQDDVLLATRNFMKYGIFACSEIYDDNGTQEFKYKTEYGTCFLKRQKNNMIRGTLRINDLVHFFGKCNEIVSKISKPKFITKYDTTEYPHVSSGSYGAYAHTVVQKISWEENELHFKYIEPCKNPGELTSIYLYFYSNFSEFSKLLTGVYSIEEYYINCILDK